MKALDEIVWAVNPRNDQLSHLLDYVAGFAVDYLSAAEIRCRLDIPDPVPPHELSSKVRYNVFLATKEALQNIVKHAAASEVWLRFSIDRTGMKLVIEDNGRGFSPAPENALADGLRNMHHRMADIGGHCAVESRVGSGTKVSLEFPLEPSR